ncbi:hypothetical protein, partial [Stenotrophomonas sp. A3_2]|uniref:hypothetical protein n=1 Tax=Stenotrophomonas sp. A3_2 TaxID=3119978 RepID=UPI002FC33E97
AHLLLLAGLAAYFLVGVAHREPGAYGAPGLILACAIRLAGEKSLLWLTLHHVLGVNLHNPPLAAMALALAAAAALLAVALRRAPTLWRPAAVTLGGILLLSALLAAGRGDAGAAFV